MPEIKTTVGGARVMSLQDPTKKMSKSDDNNWATIRLLDTPDVVVKKIKKAATDSEGVVRYDKEKQPGISNLMGIYNALTGDSFEAIESMYAGKNYGTFKGDIADLLVGALTPIHERYAELIDSPELDTILTEGAEKAASVANVTLARVEEAMGLRRK